MFTTLRVHLCLQHVVCREAARRAGSSLTCNTSFAAQNIIYFYFVQFQQFDDMAAENATAIQTAGNITKIMIVDYTTSIATFFDPTWQIVLTIEFYFQYAVLAIGIFGTAANALVLYALIAENARAAKKRIINLLIINQNLLELVS